MKKVRQQWTVMSLLACGIFASAGDANGQFAPSIADTGTVMPNVLLADINGNKTRLYDYLDSGYTIAVELFLTTCTICWAFHEEGVFEGIYQKYGPKGTVAPKKILPIMIEMSPGTTSEDLNGTGSKTQGDWVTGVHHPIIDLNRGNESDVMNSFLRPSDPFDPGGAAPAIINTPTFLVICPDRKLVYSGEGAGSLSEQSLVKLMGGRCTAGKPTEIEQIITNTSVSIYPNPAQDILNINLDAASATNAKFLISNVVGQAFAEEQIRLVRGQQAATMDIQGLPAGVYLLTISTEGGLIQKKFVVGK